MGKKSKKQTNASKAWRQPALALLVLLTLSHCGRTNDNATHAPDKEATCAQALQAGIAADSAGRFAEAIACYSRAINLCPNDARGWANRGTSRYLSGDRRGAIADWQQAAARGDEGARQTLQRFSSDRQ